MPLSVEFFKQEYWRGLSCPSPGFLPNPGIEPRSPALPECSFTIWATREALDPQKELEYRQWLFKRLYANLPITPPRNLSAPHDNEFWRIYDHLFSSDSSFSPSPKLSCYSLRRVGWYLVYSYTAEGGYSSESLQNQKVFFPGEESQNLRTKTANNFKGQVCLALKKKNRFDFPLQQAPCCLKQTFLDIARRSIHNFGDKQNFPGKSFSHLGQNHGNWRSSLWCQ